MSDPFHNRPLCKVRHPTSPPNLYTYSCRRITKMGEHVYERTICRLCSSISAKRCRLESTPSPGRQRIDLYGVLPAPTWLPPERLLESE